MPGGGVNIQNRKIVSLAAECAPRGGGLRVSPGFGKPVDRPSLQGPSAGRPHNRQSHTELT